MGLAQFDRASGSLGTEYTFNFCIASAFTLESSLLMSTFALFVAMDSSSIITSSHVILLFKANKFSVVFYNDEYDIKHSCKNQNKTYVIA